MSEEKVIKLNNEKEEIEKEQNNESIKEKKKNQKDPNQAAMEFIQVVNYFLQVYRSFEDNISIIKPKELVSSSTNKLKKIIRSYKELFNELVKIIEEPLAELREKIEVQDRRLFLQNKPNKTEEEEKELKESLSKEKEPIQSLKILSTDSKRIADNIAKFFDKIKQLNIKHIEKDFKRIKEKRMKEESSQQLSESNNNTIKEENIKESNNKTIH